MHKLPIYRFSIFTSTFNRARDLQNLYKHIRNQTYKDFEWVIVNDGSLDETDNVINSFIKENKVPIQYIKQENSGKHIAWRKATEKFQGRYVITADDDDPITHDMLEIHNKYWEELENSENYNEYWEVASRCKTPDGKLVGKPLPIPYYDSNRVNIRYKEKNFCEVVGSRKVEVLREEASVPESFIFEDKCSNFSEGIRWFRAGLKYKTRFVPDITRIYVPNPDGLVVSKKKNIKKEYNSIVSSIYTLNEQRKYLLKYDKRNYLLNLATLAVKGIQTHNLKIILLNLRTLERILLLGLYAPAFIISKFK